MFVVYWFLWLFLAVMIVWNMFAERRTSMRLAYGVALIPFLLRMLLLK